MATRQKKTDTGVKAPHQALYRTYRPHTFDDVEGQEHIVAVLTAAIQKGTVGHAYVFAGTRGTGKTSLARILARALAINERDVLEIDAASNRGIDDVREIRDGVAVLPFASEKKMYIVDEAHMLTKEAWNALLKTIEEPPAHVVFVFATTELDRVPDTIRSRCEVYQLKEPSRELLSRVVTTVAGKEGYTLEVSAAELIATLAAGSFRDALSLLQKALTVSSSSTISRADVDRVSGAPQHTEVGALVAALAQGDLSQALAAVAKVRAHDADARILIRLVLERVRAIMLARNAPQVFAQVASDYTEDERRELEALARDAKVPITSKTLQLLLQASYDIPVAALPYLPLEMALMDILAPQKAA
jgi:DNA polymerase-3 subunit gamma/tau